MMLRFIAQFYILLHNVKYIHVWISMVLNLFRISTMYFYWLRKISSSLCHTSNPKNHAKILEYCKQLPSIHKHHEYILLVGGSSSDLSTSSISSSRVRKYENTSWFSLWIFEWGELESGSSMSISYWISFDHLNVTSSWKSTPLLTLMCLLYDMYIMKVLDDSLQPTRFPFLWMAPYFSSSLLTSTIGMNPHSMLVILFLWVIA